MGQAEKVFLMTVQVCCCAANVAMLVWGLIGAGLVWVVCGAIGLPGSLILTVLTWRNLYARKAQSR